MHNFWFTKNKILCQELLIGFLDGFSVFGVILPCLQFFTSLNIEKDEVKTPKPMQKIHCVQWAGFRICQIPWKEISDNPGLQPRFNLIKF